ncbi:MAG: hypothetical protein AVDCRST_MAG73-2928, partial [uncultured Thermomicrobiales bacterium]
VRDRGVVAGRDGLPGDDVQPAGEGRFDRRAPTARRRGWRHARPRPGRGRRPLRWASRVWADGQRDRGPRPRVSGRRDGPGRWRGLALDLGTGQERRANQSRLFRRRARARTVAAVRLECHPRRRDRSRDRAAPVRVRPDRGMAALLAPDADPARHPQCSEFSRPTGRADRRGGSEPDRAAGWRRRAGRRGAADARRNI